MIRPMTPPVLSARTEHLRQASVLRTLTERVAALPDGINLGQGVCDLDMPETLRTATLDAIRNNRATYTPFAGIESLRQAIAERMEQRYGVRFDVDEIVVTTGSSGALSATFFTLLDPGDTVVLFEPFYPYHVSGARLAGARVETVRETGDGEPDWTALEAALRDHPRLLVLNTPSNPSGHVWTADALERLSALLDGTPTTLVTDEIYEDLVYEGATHAPPASIAALRERTVTISGLSKAYSITGWRLGWLAAPRPLAAAIGPVFDTLCVCAPRPLQEGAAIALASIPNSYYEDLCRAYQDRRDRLAAALVRGGLKPRIPAGAYYMLADYRERYGPIPSREASLRLLDELHIAAIPGEIFYENEAPPLVRFHFAVEAPVLAEVERRLTSGR